MRSVIVSKTMIPAAASVKNPFCGRDTQLNICIGKTVKGSRSPLSVKWIKGASLETETGGVGKNGIYVNAPRMINGAVSPTALDIARMIPVMILPIPAGRT